MNHDTSAVFSVISSYRSSEEMRKLNESQGNCGGLDRDSPWPFKSSRYADLVGDYRYHLDLHQDHWEHPLNILWDVTVMHYKEVPVGWFSATLSGMVWVYYCFMLKRKCLMELCLRWHEGTASLYCAYIIMLENHLQCLMKVCKRRNALSDTVPIAFVKIVFYSQETRETCISFTPIGDQCCHFEASALYM